MGLWISAAPQLCGCGVKKCPLGGALRSSSFEQYLISQQRRDVRLGKRPAHVQPKMPRSMKNTQFCPKRKSESGAGVVFQLVFEGGKASKRFHCRGGEWGGARFGDHGFAQINGIVCPRVQRQSKA